MKILYENSTSILTLTVNDENPATCISVVTTDAPTIITATASGTLHQFNLAIGSLGEAVASKVVKFTYTISDAGGNTNTNHEYYLIQRKALIDAGAVQKVSMEELIYYNLLNEAPYDKAYYDTFDNPGIFSGGSTAIYNSASGCYNGVAGNTFIHHVISGGVPYDSFLLHIEKDESLPILAAYSLDGSTYVNIPTSSPNNELDTIISVVGGFTNLFIRIIWDGTGDIYSYGVLYDNNPSPTIDTIFAYTNRLEHFSALGTIPGGTPFTLPNAMSYITDGKSLEIYKNRERLIKDVDYAETSGTQVTFVDAVVAGNDLVFVEKHGYVDNSSTNTARLDLEHTITGQHKFIDLTTHLPYTIVIDNASFYLEEL